MWELLTSEQRTLVLTRTEELGTGSVWLFCVRVAQHGGSTGGSLGPHDTQGPHTSQDPFFPFSPTALLAFSLLLLHLLCPSLLFHHYIFPKCHQIAQSAKRSQSYHKLSPGNFHKLIIGAVITCVEGGQRSLYGVHHPRVIERGQQGAVWAHLQHILRRVCAERRNPSGGVIVGVHPSSACLERPKSIQMASGVLSAAY